MHRPGWLLQLHELIGWPHPYSLHRRMRCEEPQVAIKVVRFARKLLTDRFVPAQRLQFRHEPIGKIGSKPPEISLGRSAQKQTRRGTASSGLVDKHHPRVVVMGK